MQAYVNNLFQIKEAKKENLYFVNIKILCVAGGEA